MDRDAFDGLAKFLAASPTRRAALGALLGAGLLGADRAAAAASRKRKRRVGTEAASRCYPGTRCVPGPGKNASGCDFSGSTAFFGKNVRGANLSNSNFTGASLARADLRGANMSGACLAGTDLSAAKLGSSVNLGGATFCRTLMPNGKFNDDDCGKVTRCCPVPEVDPCKDCDVGCGRPGETCDALFAPCCPRYLCTPSFAIIPSCQIPCAVDSDCRFWGEGGKCQYDLNSCPFMDRCCVFPSAG